jgi:hypothetical protein
MSRENTVDLKPEWCWSKKKERTAAAQTVEAVWFSFRWMAIPWMHRSSTSVKKSAGWDSLKTSVLMFYFSLPKHEFPGCSTILSQRKIEEEAESKDCCRKLQPLKQCGSQSGTIRLYWMHRTFDLKLSKVLGGLGDILTGANKFISPPKHCRENNTHDLKARRKTKEEGKKDCRRVCKPLN